jgi:cell division protease FtsH
MGIQKPFSEETGRMIDEEVRILVSSCYERSKKILETNKESLGKIADLLFKKEVIYREDLDRILGKKTIKNDLNPLTPLRRISQDKKLKKKVIA